MSLLPFGSLPAYRPRSFVPANVNFSEWSELQPIYERLAREARECTTPTGLEQWLLHWGEFSAAIDEESSRRYIAMTCHTDDETAKKSYLQFVEEIEPKLKPQEFALAQAYLAHPCRRALPVERYQVFDRDIAVEVELFRPENVPLETEETKLGQQYQEISGALTVQFQGEERTLPQMARFLEEPDRALRQQAWELTARRRLQEAPRFEDIFTQLAALRERIAAQAGFGNYRGFAFRRKRRFDYTPDNCAMFHDAVESEVMPIVRELQEGRRNQLGVDRLRPWDGEVDPLNRAPLRPFQNVDDLVGRSQQIFDRLDPELGASFQEMRRLRLLDLDNRKGKAPGGYQSTLNEARLPFIFMNAVGLQRDVETMLHEAGHAFHALATQNEDLYSYRHGPIEFCEVASMSMELLGNEYLEQFYSPEECRRARRVHLEGIVKFFPWMATVDAFQHWVYTHPGHSTAERSAAWIGLMERFGGTTDWTGFEEVRTNLWHRQLHIFLYPFYYVEYGIAQLGALQVWANSRRNQAAALASYRKSLALGGSRPLPELFAAAGCRFAFDAQTIRPLMQLIQGELGRL